MKLKKSRYSFASNIAKLAILFFIEKISRKNLSSGHDQLAIMAFDHIGNQINLFGKYEANELECFFLWAKQNNLILGCAIDVGANIGNHSIYFSRYYDSVISFEPNPRIYNLLQFNCGYIDNIDTNELAVSNTCSESYLTINPQNIGASAIDRYPLQGRQSTKIKTITLDSFEAIRNKKIGLLKIDVEGHESKVLMGATEILKKNMPVVFFEQHENEITEDGTSEATDILKSIGYKKFFTYIVTPRISNKIPKPIRIPLTIFLRLLFGPSHCIVEINRFEKRFYPAVFAVPEPKNSDA